MAEITTVGVVGAGTMGSGIAHVFARSGFTVLLCDVEQRFLDRALGQIRTNLGREAAKGKLAEAEIEPTLARIKPIVDREALAAAEFAVEVAPERFELKEEIFRALDRILPETAVLATNTSSISITKLAGLTRRPDAGDRHALLQSCAGDGAGGGGAGNGDQRRDFHGCACTRDPVGKDSGSGERCAGICFESRADAVDQRGGICGDGRSCHAGGCRPGVQVGDGAPDGSADAG